MVVEKQPIISHHLPFHPLRTSLQLSSGPSSIVQECRLQALLTSDHSGDPGLGVSFLLFFDFEGSYVFKLLPNECLVSGKANAKILFEHRLENGLQSHRCGLTLGVFMDYRKIRIASIGKVVRRNLLSWKEGFRRLQQSQC